MLVCIRWKTAQETKSYLIDRQQALKLNMSLSRTEPVTQGSIIGPLICLLFIKDLTTALEKTTSFGYANDFKAIISGQSELHIFKLKKC